MAANARNAITADARPARDPRMIDAAFTGVELVPTKTTDSSS